MHEVHERAEMFIYKFISEDETLGKIFADRIYQLFAPANTVSSKPNFILIQRISDVVADRSLSDKADKVRTVRLQIDIWDKSYQRAINNSEKLRKLLENEFPSCVENGTIGADNIGNTTWVVASIDIILTEINDEEEKL